MSGHASRRLTRISILVKLGVSGLDFVPNRRLAAQRSQNYSPPVYVAGADLFANLRPW